MFRQPYLHTANIRECCVSMVVLTCYITIIYKYTLCVDIHTRGKQHTYNLAYIITKILLCNDSSKISEPQIIFTKMIYFSCFPKSQSKIISRSIHFNFTLTFWRNEKVNHLCKNIFAVQARCLNHFTDIFL